ncbi:MAG: hypothetical protein JSU80_06815 [Deltaproteobacteria bacterium]|nr:MAG: hypothetical protein JSU80_06815 [Deltaproteobacteria bacterium]
MRFRSLSELERPEPKEVILATLPQEITMANYAKAKAFKINELVREIHQESYVWYGFTIADKNNPELIADVGLPKNDQNLQDFTTLGPERIAEYHESLPADAIINGWIHSHGALKYKHFSHTDEQNQATVLDFVTARLRWVVAKKEVPIQDLHLLVKGEFEESDLEKGSVSLITDGAISEATIMETIYGGFCYSIVIDDEGWHEQEIHYKERGVLSGHSMVSKKSSDIVFIDTGRSLTEADIELLSKEVEENIQPNINPPPELIERM